jgi:uncharacterized protein (DUF2267 family)
MTSVTQVWDKAVLKSNEWLKELGDELGWETPHATLFALRSVLHALRDRLTPNEAVDLAAQMPLLIKGVYFDSWKPSATPVKARTKEQFLALVKKSLARGGPEADAERVTRAVFKLIADRVSQGEIHDVRMILPPEVAELWPQEAKTA